MYRNLKAVRYDGDSRSDWKIKDDRRQYRLNGCLRVRESSDDRNPVDGYHFFATKIFQDDRFVRKSSISSEMAWEPNAEFVLRVTAFNNILTRKQRSPDS